MGGVQLTLFARRELVDRVKVRFSFATFFSPRDYVNTPASSTRGTMVIRYMGARKTRSARLRDQRSWLGS